jgi:hypothetical protein
MSVPVIVAFRAIVVFFFFRPDDARFLLIFFGSAGVTIALYRLFSSKIESESARLRFFDRNGLTRPHLIAATAGFFCSLFLYLGSVRVAASL